MLWCNTGRLTTPSQLCAEALDSLGQGGKAAGAPSVKIPASSPMDIPGSPLSPSVLKPVAAIATLFNSREQRIQQQKERRDRRKEMLKLGKSSKADAASKGNACGANKCAACDGYDTAGESKDDEKDSDEDAPTSLSWSSSTHATLTRDVRLAIERA